MVSSSKKGLIENKILNIRVNNHFKSGYKIFSLGKSFTTVNRIDDSNSKYLEVIKEIKNYISLASKVVIFFKKPFLSPILIEELEYQVKNGLDFEINIENKNIYKFDFGKIIKHKLPISANLLYIFINGKSHCYLFDKDVFRANNLDYNSIINNSITSLSLVLANNYDSAFYLEESKVDYNLLKELKDSIPNTSLFIDVSIYNKAVYDDAVKKDYDVYISSKIESGIYLVKNNLIFKLIVINNHYLVVNTTFDYLFSSFDKYYKLTKLPINLEYSKLKDDLYIINTNQIIKLDIKPEIIINKTIQYDNIDDFINEKYDSQITHCDIDYSESFKCITYCLTLIPPLYNVNLPKSKLYDKGIKISSSLIKHLKTYALIDFSNELKQLGYDNKTVHEMIEFTLDLENILPSFFKEFDLKNYYDIIEHSLSTAVKYDFEVLPLFLSINGEMISKNNNVIVAQIDVDIQNYNKILLEKSDDIKNKARISSLKEEISKLEKMKLNFIEDKSIKESLNENFKIKLLNSDANNEVEQSQKTILKTLFNPNETTIENKLEELLLKNYKQFNQYFNKICLLLTELSKIDIPCELIVYGDTNREVPIKNYEQIEIAKEISKKYNAKIVVER